MVQEGKKKKIMNNYFLNIINQENKQNVFINYRKNLRKLNKKKYYIIRGDIVNITYWVRNFKYKFEGLCLGFKKQGVVNPTMSIYLRNVIEQTGVDVVSSFYLHRLNLNNILSDYKRKYLWYRASKLLFLQKKKNKTTKISEY